MDEKLIKKELNLTIQDNEAILDEPLHLYRNDKNIDIFITISNLKFDFLTGMPQTENVVYSTNAQYFSIRIVKPNGEKIPFPHILPTINNRVGFSIEEEFIDALDEVGVYQLQISLHADMNGESRITIPPINFEVHEHIYGDYKEINGDYGENTYFAKVIDENADINAEEIKASVVDDTRVIRSNLIYEQYKNRRELKLGTELYLWQAGDYIDSARLNAIHDFILDLDEDVEELHENTKDIPSDIADIQTDITGIQTDITNIRNNLNKNIEAKDVIYMNYDFVNVEQALNHLLYEPMEITSFTCNAISTIKEYGSYFSNITFNWEYNKNVVSHSFYGENLSNLRLREYLYKPAFNSDRTFTLVAKDEKTTTQKSISFYFYKRMYWGTTKFLTSSSSLSVLINELQNSELRNSHKDSITVNAEQGQYIYYIVPTEFADCEFSVNGFIGGISLVATNVLYLNMYDKEIRYNVYRSDNHSLGNTTIKIL